VTDAALVLAVERRVPWVAGELAYWRWRTGVHDEVAPELVAEPSTRFSPTACSCRTGRHTTAAARSESSA
jgi:hypothetical protein